MHDLTEVTRGWDDALDTGHADADLLASLDTEPVPLLVAGLAAEPGREDAVQHVLAALDPSSGPADAHLASWLAAVAEGERIIDSARQDRLLALLVGVAGDGAAWLRDWGGSAGWTSRLRD